MSFTRRSCAGSRNDHRKQIAIASTSSARSSRTACSACPSFRGTTTSPKQSTRSETPRMRRFGTIGVGFRLSGMCTTWRTSRPSSPREPRMMWMTSLWPRVVTRPMRAPRFCTIALVPTVVPWEMSEVFARRSATGRPHFPAAASSAFMRPSAKSPGVEGAFALTTCPRSSTSTQSVNVPPMSSPQRYVDMGPPALLPWWSLTGVRPARRPAGLYHHPVPSPSRPPSGPAPSPQGVTDSRGGCARIAQ